MLRSGHYIGGRTVTEFEEAWAGFVDAQYCVGVGNGLDALTLALRASGVGPGDEVIVPAHTFIATWLAVTQTGATPVPVDPPDGCHLIEATGVAAAITDRTRAVVPVHLYGDPVNLDPLLVLAKQRGLMVIEDAAQAHGARYHGRRIGSHGDCVAWSFYPGKNLGAAGDGGAVTTNNEDLAARIRLLGNYGSTNKYIHKNQGINSRLDAIQAAVLRVKLTRLDEWNDRRRAHANTYRSAIPTGFLLKAPERAEAVHHLMVVRVKNRDRVRQALRLAGIETGVHYPTPPHRQQAYRAYAHETSSSFPVTERLAASVLSLPIGPQLNTGHVDQVLEHLLPLLEA